jgi:hypothetical protein
MIVPKPESVGLPPRAGNFELSYAPAHGRLILACVAPTANVPELLVARVYSRRSTESEYSLLGSTDPLESWTSPLLWRSGLLVVSYRVSPSMVSDATLNHFLGIKYVDLLSCVPKTLWLPPNSSTWVVSLLNQGSSPDEVYCLVGHSSDSSDRHANYTVAALDLGKGSITDAVKLATPGF